VEYFVSYLRLLSAGGRTSLRAIDIEEEATIQTRSWISSGFPPRVSVLSGGRDLISCLGELQSTAWDRLRPTMACCCCWKRGRRLRREDITPAGLWRFFTARNDSDFRRGTFRVRGDVIEVYPTYDEMAYRIELFGNEIEAPVADRSTFRDGAAEICPACRSIRSRTTWHSRERKKTAIDSILEELGVWEKQAGVRGDGWWRSQRIHQAHSLRPGNDQVHGLLPWDRKTTRGTSPGGCRGNRRPHCWITFRRDIWCSLYERT